MKVVVINYRTQLPTRLVTFTLDDATGKVACDNERILATLTENGIAVPDDSGIPHLVYPSDGKAFMDALPYAFAGMLRAQPPTDD